MKLTISTLLGLLVLGATTAYAVQTDVPKMNGKLRVSTLSPGDVRYTGKPFVKELAVYVFNYRNYSPDLARWTTPDPLAFPDGPNNHLYAPTPTSQLDPFGLQTIAFEVVTEIRPPDIEAGMKTTQYAFVDSGTGNMVSQGGFAGTTNVPLIGPVTGSFSGNATSSLSDCIVTVDMSGQGQSATFPYAIVYDFTFELDLEDGSGTLTGNHKGYPSYVGEVGSTKVYDFQQGSIIELSQGEDSFGPVSFQTPYGGCQCE